MTNDDFDLKDFLKGALEEAFGEVKQYKDRKVEIEMKILELFETNKINPSVAYMILEDLIDLMEKVHPNLALSRAVTDKIVEKANPETLDRFNELVNLRIAKDELKNKKVKGKKK